MTNLTKEHLEEFKQLYFNRTGQELSDQEALESATNLLNFTKIGLGMNIE